MLYFVHILTGAVIAKYFPSVIPIIILSLIFHFVIDMIPHKDNLMEKKLTKKNYDIKLTKEMIIFEIIQILISIVLIIAILLKFNNLLMFLGIFFSLFPDILKLGYGTRIKNNRVFKNYLHFHSIIQTEVSWKIGTLTQTAITIALLLVLFY